MFAPGKRRCQFKNKQSRRLTIPGNEKQRKRLPAGLRCAKKPAMPSRPNAAFYYLYRPLK